MSVEGSIHLYVTENEPAVQRSIRDFETGFSHSLDEFHLYQRCNIYPGMAGVQVSHRG